MVPLPLAAAGIVGTGTNTKEWEQIELHEQAQIKSSHETLINYPSWIKSELWGDEKKKYVLLYEYGRNEIRNK